MSAEAHMPRGLCVYLPCTSAVLTASKHTDCLALHIMSQRYCSVDKSICIVCILDKKV